MSSIERYGASFGGSRRQVARVQRAVDLEITRIEATGDVEGAAFDEMAALTTRAMKGVAMVSQAEQQLGQLVPLAVSRLQALGDVHALVSVDELTRRVRRL